MISVILEFLIGFRASQQALPAALSC